MQLNRGGEGTRELYVPVQGSFGEVLPLMKEIHFSGGVADVMTFKIGNFKGEEAEQKFTLANYIAKYKLTKVRPQTHLVEESGPIVQGVVILEDEGDDQEDKADDVSFQSISRDNHTRINFDI